MALIRARFAEFKFVVVLTATVGLVVVIVGACSLLFGNAVAGLVGLGLASVATKVFEVLDKRLNVPQQLEVTWSPPQWTWSAVAGILIVQASDILTDILMTALRLSGLPSCTTGALVGIGLTSFAGFAICGYVAGRVTPARATAAVALGLIVLAAVQITDIAQFTDDRMKSIGQCLKTPPEEFDFASLRIAIMLGLIPRAFLSLYAASFGARHQMGKAPAPPA